MTNQNGPTQVTNRIAPSKRQREMIRQKTGGLCHICGGPLGERWVADHVKPVAKGGASSPTITDCAISDNLAAALGKRKTK